MHLRHRPGREVLFPHGGTSKKARNEIVARFQAPGGPAVSLLSLEVAGCSQSGAGKRMAKAAMRRSGCGATARVLPVPLETQRVGDP